MQKENPPAGKETSGPDIAQAESKEKQHEMPVVERKILIYNPPESLKNIIGKCPAVLPIVRYTKDQIVVRKDDREIALPKEIEKYSEQWNTRQVLRLTGKTAPKFSQTPDTIDQGDFLPEEWQAKDIIFPVLKMISNKMRGSMCLVGPPLTADGQSIKDTQVKFPAWCVMRNTSGTLNFEPGYLVSQDDIRKLSAKYDLALLDVGGRTLPTERNDRFFLQRLQSAVWQVVVGNDGKNTLYEPEAINAATKENNFFIQPSILTMPIRSLALQDQESFKSLLNYFQNRTEEWNLFLKALHEHYSGIHIPYSLQISSGEEEKLFFVNTELGSEDLLRVLNEKYGLKRNFSEKKELFVKELLQKKK